MTMQQFQKKRRQTNKPTNQLFKKKNYNNTRLKQINHYVGVVWGPGWGSRLRGRWVGSVSINLPQCLKISVPQLKDLAEVLHSPIKKLCWQGLVSPARWAYTTVPIKSLRHRNNIKMCHSVCPAVQCATEGAAQ